MPAWLLRLALPGLIALLVEIPALAGLSSAAPWRPEPRFETVGAGNIPRDVVATMVQDHAGRLWIGTGDGLVRFDGYRFQPQERKGRDAAQRNMGWIQAMLAARDGRVWFGTESDGLASYEPRSGRIQMHPDARLGTGPQPTIRALAEGPDGAIWYGSTGGGLRRYLPEPGRHEPLPEPARGMAEQRVSALLFDRQGTLWVGTWSGLYRFAPGAARFELLGPELRGHRVNSLLQTSDDSLWVGTQDGALGRIEPGGAGVQVQVGGSPVNSLLEAPEGKVWVGRNVGIDVHALHGGRLLQRLRSDRRNPEGLAAGEVTTLLRDRAGWIWVAGFGVGLQRHNPEQRAITVRGPELQAGNPLHDANVHALLQMPQGEIWAANAQPGLVLMNAGLGVMGRFELAGRPDARVQAMALARGGSAWLATGAELHQYSTQRRLLRRVVQDVGPVRRLFVDRDAALWIGTEDGLHLLRPGSPSTQRVAMAGGGRLSGFVTAFQQDATGVIWVGSAQGLYRIEPGEQQLRAVPAVAGQELAAQPVIGLLIDSQQRLWVDTAVGGLHCLTAWDGRMARFDRISSRHGIVGRPFGVNMLEDELGRIWTHMHVYDPASDHLDELRRSDGADIGTGWFYAYLKTADGRLLFGGSRGMMVVRPGAYQTSRYAPPLVVSELRINGEPRAADQLPGGLEIRPDQRSFSLQFAALDFVDPGRIRYAYRLEGFDPEWIETGAELRVASYSNLPPGDYVLRVRATNHQGVWSPGQLAVSLRVLPAWWQRPWVALAGLVLAVALAYGLMQLRTLHLRRRQLLLERNVRDRTWELESMAQALREASITDPLTGLHNRRFLTQHIGADAALAVRRHLSHLHHGGPAPEGAELLFFLIDFDHFKHVNDQHGHAAGDAVLRQMRGRLRAVFRDGDYLVRWGGEEFLVVARGSARASAAALAERVRQSVAARPFELDDGESLTRSCSIGFACFPLCPEHPDALDWSATVSVADAALYQAKQSGRDAWVGAVRARAETADSLHEATLGGWPDWLASGRLEVARSSPPTAQD